MGNLSQNLTRARRIPARIGRDTWLIRNLVNWREALAAEWQRTPLTKVRLRSGVAIDGPPAIDLAFLFHETWIRQVYTPPGYEINKNETVIDIGGNIGVFALYAATRAEGVRVFCYEPFPDNVALLRNNLQKSGISNVQVNQQAVSGHSGTRHLQVNPDNWIVHSLFGKKNSAEQGLAVDCISLDDVFSENQIQQCDLLKLDCEGSEYEILENCSPETLRRVRRIVGEFHEGPHINGTGDGLCRFLESRSFRVDTFQRDEGGGLLSARNMASA